VSGRGVLGTINGQQTLIGRASWIEEQGIDLTGLDQTGSEGLSLLYVVQGGRPLGWIGLEDKTRPTAAAALDDLRQLGVNKLVMVTGDRWSVAQRVAREMHCSDVQAEVLPAQKLELVDELKKQGHIVAVVGDGVNDAPALAAGDVGIAMGAAGSDVAINSAQIALMNNNLNRIPFLIRLSRKTVNVVRQNLAGSMVYIVGFLALAAFGAIPAVVAVLLHLVSSLVVVFNSARLVREGEDIEHAEASAQAGQTAPRRTEPTPPALPSGQPALG
jgi:Cd2+/Zn2+-exporting ATPase